MFVYRDSSRVDVHTRLYRIEVARPLPWHQTPASRLGLCRSPCLTPLRPGLFVTTAVVFSCSLSFHISHPTVIAHDLFPPTLAFRPYSDDLTADIGPQSWTWT